MPPQRFLYHDPQLRETASVMSKQNPIQRLTDELEHDLTARYGVMLGSNALWRELGFRSPAAFRVALSRGMVGVTTFIVRKRPPYSGSPGFVTTFTNRRLVCLFMKRARIKGCCDNLFYLNTRGCACADRSRFVAFLGTSISPIRTAATHPPQGFRETTGALTLLCSRQRRLIRS